MRLCQAIKHRRELGNIIWSCNARVDKVDPELISKMAEAGCRTIWYGIESGSQDSLNRMKKGIALAQAVKVCQWTKEAGIGLRVNILIGFPWEDRSMIYETIRFTKSLKPDQIQFACVVPWPGTQLYQQARDSGYLKRKDPSDFDYSKPTVMPTKSLSIKELEKTRRACLYKLYLDPCYILRTIFYNLHSPWQLIGYLQRFRDKFLGDGSLSLKKRLG